MIISVEEAPALVGAIREINPRAFLLGKVTSTDDISQRVLQLYRAGFNGAIIDSLGGGTASSYAEWRDFCGGTQNILASRIAHQTLESQGIDDFFLIVSGRLISARDVYWAIRAGGANAFTTATGALAIMDCIMAQNCSNACPTYITTYPPEKLDTPETEARIVAEWTRRLIQYFHGFQVELATYLARTGFRSIGEARGNLEGVAGNLSPQERNLLGIREHTVFHMPRNGNGLLSFEERRIQRKRKTGKAADGAMGTAADLQTGQDPINTVRARIPRHLTGPSNEHPREPTNTRTTIGSIDGWGGVLLKQADPLAEYFGYRHFGEIPDPVLTITSSAQFDSILPALRTDQKTVLYIQGDSTDDKLALLHHVHEKLLDRIIDGRVLRKSVSILVDGELRPRELTVYTCKGADAVVVDVQGTEEERMNLYSAVLEQEFHEFASAMGLNGRAAMVGTEELIAADPLVPKEEKDRWGLRWFGES